MSAVWHVYARRSTENGSSWGKRTDTKDPLTPAMSSLECSVVPNPLDVAPTQNRMQKTPIRG
jgi:hypothetical protein